MKKTLAFVSLFFGNISTHSYDWSIDYEGFHCIDYQKYESRASNGESEDIPNAKSVDIGYVLNQTSCTNSPSNAGGVFITSPVP